MNKRPQIFLPNVDFTTFIFCVIYNLLFYSLLRVLFLIRNFRFYQNISAKDILLSFISGLRFDLSSVTVIICFFFLFLQLPFVEKLKFWRFVRKFLTFLVFLILNISYAILFIDVFYYEHAARRLSAVEILSLHSHFGEMSKVVLISYLWVVFVAVGFLVLFNFLLIKFMKLARRIVDNNEGTVVNKIIYFFVFVIICTIFIRGGLQDRPLRPAFAFEKYNVQLGHLSLNGVYTLLHSVWKTWKIKLEIGAKEFANNTYKNIFQTLIKTENEKFIDENYFLVRHTYYKEPMRKLNVVIFIMENWSPWASSVYSDKFNNITVNFDKLAKEGMVFKNFYSCANRTWPGISAVLFSIPPVFMVSIADEPFNQNTYRSIAHILKEVGYKTIFIHGGRKNTFSFDILTKCLGGFENSVFMEDFDLSKVKVDKSWGVHDEYVFLRANEEFKKLGEPFLGVVLGLTPHEPYDIPEEFKVIPSSVPEAEYLNSLKYSDYGLGKFFEQAKKEKYFENTLFIIVSDHQNPVYSKNMFDAHRIVCLFYSPKYIKPTEYTKPACQLDILPSIVDFLKISTIHSSFGKSVFAKDNDRFVFCTRNEVFYWIKNDKVLMHNLDKILGVYNYIKDPDLSNNLITSSDYSWLEKEFFSFYFISRYVLIRNLIYNVKFDKTKSL